MSCTYINSSTQTFSCLKYITQLFIQLTPLDEGRRQKGGANRSDRGVGCVIETVPDSVPVDLRAKLSVCMIHLRYELPEVGGVNEWVVEL